MDKLPIYRAIVGDDVETGMITISLVDEPAVEVDFLYFNEDKKPLSFAVEDEEQRKVLGVVMTADSPIYRRDENGFEYYIVYDRQTIEKMAEKYIRQNKANNVDLNHSFVLEDGIYLNEFFIKDTAKGISPTGFENVNDGSLFAIFHVENDEVWNAIKEGTFKGFSLSGLFNTELVQLNKVKDNRFMTQLRKIKAVLRSLLVEMGEVSTDKGILVWDGDEDIKVGDAVKGLDEEGNEIEVADGEYNTDDKKTIVVADGTVTEIREPEEEPVEEKPADEPADEPEQNEEQPNDEPADEPAEDERDIKIKELEETIAAKDAEIEALKAKIAELENEPAAKPAEEEFAKATAKEDNTPKGKMSRRGYKF